jgi:hypothetical protein
MRIIDDAVWAPVTAATGDSGRPGIMEAAAGWLVLLSVIAFIVAAGYLALWFFDLL